MSSDIFRDRSEGANARRLDLLRRRRDELITMPHAVRRVFVDRSARIAASLVAFAGGLVIAATAAIPPLTKLFESVLPGANPAALSQIMLATWIATIVVYAMARSRSEHRFIVAMSKYVLPGEDVDHDIERLSHEHPDAVAKNMAQKLEVRSAGLPVLAATLLLPATVLFIAECVMIRGWSQEFELILDAQAPWLVGFGVLGIALGYVMTRPWARMPLVGRIAGPLAVLTAFALPLVFMKSALWVVAPFAITTTIAIVVRRLRIERALIDAVDPAAGSELFSLKKTIAEARAWISGVRITKPMVLGVCGAALLYILGATPTSMSPQPTKASAAAVAPAMAKPNATTNTNEYDPDESQRSSSSKSWGPARATVRVDIHNGARTSVNAVAGLSEVPHGWKLVLDVKHRSNIAIEAVTGLGVATTRTDDDELTTKVEISACYRPLPLGFVVVPQESGNSAPDWDEHDMVELSVEPRLVYSPCN